MILAAAAATIILSWQAHSFVPANYAGKVLPPRDSVVDVYLEFTDNGKITPLDENIIRWEVNGKFLVGGANLKHITLPLDRFTTRTYAVTATVKNYNEQDVQKTVIVSRATPLVTLKSYGSDITATPYFFSSPNISDYVFNWIADGISAESKLSKLNLALPVGAESQTVSIEATASNRNNEVESATGKTQFIINP